MKQISTKQHTRKVRTLLKRMSLYFSPRQIDIVTTTLRERDEVIIKLLEEFKDYNNGKPEPRNDYDCDCGYEYDDCVCETNRTLNSIIKKIRGEL